MTISNHPDDERLAALAGSDRDAERDRSLRTHVAACDRCRDVVGELSALRSALAQLPDVAPPPGFRAWSPAAVPTRDGTGMRLREMLRRAFAPAMLAGAGLAIVGAVGISGVLDYEGRAAGGAALQAPAAAENATADDDTDAGAGAEFDRDATGSVAIAAASAESERSELEEAAPEESHPSDTDQAPWAAMVAGGIVLFAGALLGRRLLEDRPG
ncbi:MAG: anti-sigma factor [Candidatus Limnocylindria bacterium]